MTVIQLPPARAIPVDVLRDRAEVVRRYHTGRGRPGLTAVLSAGLGPLSAWSHFRDPADALAIARAAGDLRSREYALAVARGKVRAQRPWRLTGGVAMDLDNWIGSMLGFDPRTLPKADASEIRCETVARALRLAWSQMTTGDTERERPASGRIAVYVPATWLDAEREWIDANRSLGTTHAERYALRAAALESVVDELGLNQITAEQISTDRANVGRACRARVLPQRRFCVDWSDREWDTLIGAAHRHGTSFADLTFAAAQREYETVRVHRQISAQYAEHVANGSQR